ncbi:MAG: hypothetical protein V3S07_04535 [Micropepsaceae bacterium]
MRESVAAPPVGRGSIRALTILRESVAALPIGRGFIGALTILSDTILPLRAGLLPLRAGLALLLSRLTLWACSPLLARLYLNQLRGAGVSKISTHNAALSGVLKREFLSPIILCSTRGHRNRNQKSKQNCQNRLHNDLSFGHTPSTGVFPNFMSQQSADLANAPIAGAWSYSRLRAKNAPSLLCNSHSHAVEHNTK